MNHNIKAGDIVRRITHNPNSAIAKGETFTVHKVFENNIYYRDGFALNYEEVELVEPKLLHQQWKDLHDKGVELEWTIASTNWYPTRRTSGKAISFNSPGYKYRVKDHGYEHYKTQLDQIDLSFMIGKDIVVEAYGLISLAQALVDRGAECGARRVNSVASYLKVKRLNKCFGLTELSSEHGSLSYYKFNNYTILSFQELLDHPEAQKCQPTFNQEYLQPKEKTMNPLDLILLSIFMQEDKPKDATNANHIAVLTEADGTYVGYIYADDSTEFDDVMRKPENESRKLHIFNYDSTIAQKPRKIVKVDRV